MTTVHSASPVGPDGIIRCFCDEPVREFISRTDRNPGRKFYRCDTSACTFWKWSDSLKASGNSANPSPSNEAHSRSLSQPPAVLPNYGHDTVDYRPPTPSTPSSGIGSVSSGLLSPRTPPTSQIYEPVTPTRKVHFIPPTPVHPSRMASAPPCTPTRARALSPGARARRRALIEKAVKEAMTDKETSRHPDNDERYSSSDENADFERSHLGSSHLGSSRASNKVNRFAGLGKTYREHISSELPLPSSPKKFRPSTPDNKPPRVSATQSSNSAAHDPGRSTALLTPPPTVNKRSPDYDELLKSEDDELYMNIFDTPLPKKTHVGEGSTVAQSDTPTLQSSTKTDESPAKTYEIPSQSLSSGLSSTPPNPTPPSSQSSPSISLVAYISKSARALEDLKSVEKEMTRMERKLQASEKSEKVKAKKIEEQRMEIETLKLKIDTLQRELAEERRRR